MVSFTQLMKKREALKNLQKKNEEKFEALSDEEVDSEVGDTALEIIQKCQGGIDILNWVLNG